MYMEGNLYTKNVSKTAGGTYKEIGSNNKPDVRVYLRRQLTFSRFGGSASLCHNSETMLAMKKKLKRLCSQTT